MSKTPINMIELCNLAWDRRTKLAPSEYYQKICFLMLMQNTKTCLQTFAEVRANPTTIKFSTFSNTFLCS